MQGNLITKRVSFVNQKDKNEWEIGIGIKSFNLTIFGIHCNDTGNEEYPELLKYRALVEYDLGYISVH